MDLLDLIRNEENIRTLVLLVAAFTGFIWLKIGLQNDIKAEFAAYGKKMDDRFNNFHSMLKKNDFAHLNRTIKEMTFVLEKNNFLNAEDKKHIDARLDD
ncbi:MAG: hypothetical protein FWC23_05495 [Chitinispirillia bacterium]|nr:hypothetical protein [Chitinispirillia bacterium]MCL2268622.1 hypothetical protein [Chitinispirillia bacterium]